MVREDTETRLPTTEGVWPVEELELIGGEVCLDFANSLGGTREAPKERLHDYGDLVRWAAHVGVIEETEVRPLLGAARDGNRRRDAALLPTQRRALLLLRRGRAG